MICSISFLYSFIYFSPLWFDPLHFTVGIVDLFAFCIYAGMVLYMRRSSFLYPAYVIGMPTI